MGQYSSYFSGPCDWYVYKRWMDTDQYDDKPEQTWRNVSKRTAISRFKHEIFAYALGNYEYEGVKAIYLYSGRARVCRVSNVNNQLVIESKQGLQYLINSKETLAPTRYPELTNKFFEIYCKNYARLDVYKIAYIPKIPSTYLGDFDDDNEAPVNDEV